MRTQSVLLLSLLAFSAAGCSSLPSLGSKAAPADPTAEALFEQGMRHFSDRRYGRAIDAWQRLKAEHPFSPLVTQTELKIADAYYLNKQYPEAIAAFKEFQALHPTNENIPFVIYRLGQAHFDQFTSVDRDQKNTEIAKGYFETLVNQHPKSPYAAEAREKLAKTIEYLADHDFNVAFFYFKQEKFPAARDRFEEIIRKYRDTPIAVKSLFYLGECHRKERNSVKAALAYEALIQHYPRSQFAGEAKVQLAQLEKEKHDPLALLLMRDRRPASPSAAPEPGPDPALAKLKELNMVAKTEVVYEEPGAEKGLLRRVVDKINPFASSPTDRKNEKENQAENATELLARKSAAEKSTGGFLSWLNPFSGGVPEKKPATGKNDVVARVDESLKQKGVDPTVRTTGLTAPKADISEDAKPATPPASMDPALLLGKIDEKLQKSGTNADQMPPPPEAARVFRDPAAAQQARARNSSQSEPPPGPASSELLSSIDQKLRSRGVEPAKIESPVPAPANPSAATSPPKTVELEPRLTLEKGPLFIDPAERSTRSSEERASPLEERMPEASKPQEPADRIVRRAVVRGPAPARAADTGKPADQRRPSILQDDEPKPFLEQLRQDAEGMGKLLNPFNW